MTFMTASEENSPKELLRYTFPKEERLCSKKVIQELFQKGSSFTLYPFRIVYNLSGSNQNRWPQVLFSIPKRNFKKATDRNLLKRRCREAYRLNKYYLVSAESDAVYPTYISEIAIIYTAKEIISYNLLEKKLSLVLQRLAKNQPGINS